jgi:hypothetical protein
MSVCNRNVKCRVHYNMTRLIMKKPNKPAAEAFMGCGSAPPVTSAGSESVVSASSVGNGVAGVSVVRSV